MDGRFMRRNSVLFDSFHSDPKIRGFDERDCGANKTPNNYLQETAVQSLMLRG